MDKPQIIGHIHKSLNYTLFDCKWVPVSTKFVVVGSNPRGTAQLQVYDVTATDVKLVYEAHSEIINCIDGVGGLGVGEGAPEIATGSRDGTVKVWDPRQPKTPVVTMEPSQEESQPNAGDNPAIGSTRDCWTVAFGHA
ncbi:unnamed protein product, partial [Dibothriocephalus latus]